MNLYSIFKDEYGLLYSKIMDYAYYFHLSIRFKIK